MDRFKNIKCGKLFLISFLAFLLVSPSYSANKFIRKRKSIPSQSEARQKAAETPKKLIESKSQADPKATEVKEEPKSIRTQPASPRKSYSRKSVQYAKSDPEIGEAHIESMRDKVEVKSGQSLRWRKANRASTLSRTDEIRTGSRSMARVRLDDGSKILLLQNSQAELESLTSFEKAIKLVRGRIRAIVTKMKDSREFKIKTPIGVASVRGTDFEVEYLEESGEMEVDVKKGQVGVAKLGDLANEVVLNPGEKMRFKLDGELGDPIQTGAIPLNRQDVRTEVVIASVKNQVVSQAAEELRQADYQVGKSLIDVDGRRVRVEEYIMRPAANQFKLVVLNDRSTRFDYFTYTGTFNQNLPTDLSVALSQVGGRLGTAPDYFLTSYEMYMSNTKDYISDSGSGGHLVQIDFDGTDYTLTSGAEIKTVAAATDLGNGTYRVYNPLKDTFSTVTSEGLSGALQVGIIDSGSYRNLTNGDTYFKTRFNSNSYYINGTLKSSYSPTTGVTNVLALDLDATFGNNCGVSGTASCTPITVASENPSGSDSLHNRLSLFYSDGSKTTFDNYIINDDGNVAPSSAFAGIAGSSDYLNQLVNWNYQQKITADEMSGSIDLVVDPRIGTMSGLIQ